MSDKSAFQKVVDDATDGCGCMCHTGLGYRSGCSHCAPYQAWIGKRYRAVTCYAKNPKNKLGLPPIPVFAYIETEGEEPVIPGALVDKIIRKEFKDWVNPLEAAKLAAGEES